MPETSRAVHLLVSIAKVDNGVAAARRERQKIPVEIERIDRRIAEIDATREKAEQEFEELDRERRETETAVRDKEAGVRELNNRLMSVKNNKEYQAMLAEIENVKREVETKEERLLELFDEIEQAGPRREQQLEKIAGEREEIADRRKQMEDRAAVLDAEIERLLSEKPRLLAELDSRVRARYERGLDRHGDSKEN